MSIEMEMSEIKEIRNEAPRRSSHSDCCIVTTHPRC